MIRIFTKVGVPSRNPTPHPGVPRGRSRRDAPRAIQLPPLSCPRSGPGQTWGFATLNAGPHCTIRTSDGGYRWPITWVPYRAVEQLTGSHGYRLRLTPECLRIMIAIGQPSTDSFRAHRAKPMGLQATLVRPCHPNTHRTEATRY